MSSSRPRGGFHSANIGPTHNVLESCYRVVQQAEHVTVHREAIRRWASEQSSASLCCADDPAPLRFEGTAAEAANLMLLLASLNFCFWSDEPWEVEFAGQTWTRTYAMYAGVMRAVRQDRAWLSPARWVDADSQCVAALFAGRGRMPLLERRRQVMAETGQRLIERFDGQFVNAVESAVYHAPRLAQLLADEFPSFRDVPLYRGQAVAILKRAQICANDLHVQWTRAGHRGLDGMEELTVFADYRLPQYLRHVGAIELAGQLSDSIDRLVELPAGSPPEVELRAATIVAADMMVAELAQAGLPTIAAQLDKVLWERSHDARITIPHHRTRSIYY